MQNIPRFLCMFGIGVFLGWVFCTNRESVLPIPSPIVAELHIISAMGDSLTAEGTYVAQLVETLGSYWTVENKGIGGHATSSMLSRFTTDVTDNPNIEYVIIWGGINDINSGVSAATTKMNLQAMYDAAHLVGIKVIAVNIAPDKGSGNWTAARQIVKEEVNAWMKDEATNVDYLIDAYAALGDPEDLAALLLIYDGGDNIHLSKLGYELVGKLVAGLPFSSIGYEKTL